MVRGQSAAGRHRGDRGAGRRHPSGPGDAARRDTGPVGHPGHHPHRFRGPGAADHREPGHLPPLDGHARPAEGQGGARVLHVRRVVRLRDLQGRHRPLLGALARAGGPVQDPVRHAPRRQGADRPRRDRRRLGLPIRGRRQERQARPRAAAHPAGLVPAFRAGDRARRLRGGERRRIRERIPGAGGSGEAARLRDTALAAGGGDPDVQPGGGRARHRAGRDGIRGAIEGLRDEA